MNLATRRISARSTHRTCPRMRGLPWRMSLILSIWGQTEEGYFPSAPRPNTTNMGVADFAQAVCRKPLHIALSFLYAPDERKRAFGPEFCEALLYSFRHVRRDESSQFRVRFRADVRARDNFSATHDYFDACRRKRNEIDCTGATIATATEAEELLVHAKAFLEIFERWIEMTHPKFKR